MYPQDIKIFRSIFLHLLIVVFFFVVQKTNLLPKPDLPTKITKKVYIKSAIRVDVVGMPKFTQKELKTMDTSVQKAQEEVKVAPTPKAVEPPAKDDFIKKKKATSFKDLIKGLKNKRVDKAKVTNKKIPRAKKTGRSDGIDHAKLNKLILEGNKISKGSSLTGNQAEDLSYTKFEQYIVQLPDHVRPRWKLPSYLLEQKLQCRIQVYINANGALVKASIIESSGDNEYDSKALQAVEDSAPFPAPPSEIVKQLIQGQVVLGFPL